MSYAALVRNVEIFVMPGMIYRDRKRKREEREEREGPCLARGGGRRRGEGTDQPKSPRRIFMAMREGSNVGGKKREKEEEVMKEHLRNESCFRQHYSLARNLSTSMGGFADAAAGGDGQNRGREGWKDGEGRGVARERRQ